MAVASSQTNANLRRQLETITSPVARHLAALDAFMEGQVDAFEPEMRELVAFCLRHSGKRIRPMLLFYSGWRDDEDEPADSLVRAAAVVEFVHLATLVHDDILDEADLRHNATTVARRYGSDAAVLVGDALFAQALKLASDFPTVAVCRAVSESTRRVCAGEIAQTFQRGNAALSHSAYFRVIDLKTAELFRVSCSLGASLAGFETGFVEAVANFGRHLGIAYQIFDDLADYLGVEQAAGKTLGTDLAGGKFTLPLLLLLEDLAPVERERHVAGLRDGTVSLNHLRERMREHEIYNRVAGYFQREIEAAETALAAFPGHAAATRLLLLSDYVRLQTERINGVSLDSTSR